MVGWFFEVLPHEHHFSVPVQAGEIAISSPRTTSIKLTADPNHRKFVPVETFSITAGIKGGIAGGIAMVVPATVYGLLRFHSVWYTSVLVGLLYGAMLPMFPRKPILTAGFIAPFLWTGIIYSALGVISPILNARIDWLWFVLSQIAFGLVCGFVVNLQVKVRTPQFRALPFAVRAGIHSDQPHGDPPTLKDPSTLEEKDK